MQVHTHIQKGFSFLELIIIVMIIGLISLNIDFDISDPTIELTAEAEQVASDIRYAQTLAMTLGARYRINFFSNFYTITDVTGTVVVNNPATNQSQYDLKTNYALSTNAALTNGYIAFDSKGIPYIDSGSPGTALSTVAQVQLATGAEIVTIQIAPETGYVSI